MLCAYKRCRSGKDVRNVSQSLRTQRQNVLPDQVRRLRTHAKVARFCCVAHQKKATKPAVRRQPRGQREVLTQAQFAAFLCACCSLQCPWVAAAMLLQVCLVERATCVLNARVSWFHGLADAESGAPVSVQVPRVNGKTMPRCVRLAPSAGKLLASWLLGDGLRGHGGSQWPAAGQFQGEDFIFPGMHNAKGDRKTTANKPVTRRAYLYRLRQVADHLSTQRKKHHVDADVWKGVDLSKVGSHTCKRSAVTWLKQLSVSSKVVSAISGTSVQTLERIYDCPTQQRMMLGAEAAVQEICCSIMNHD